MKTSRIIFGGLAGSVAFFFLGWMIYGIILHNFIQANYNNCAARPMEEMVWPALILSNLFMGYLIALAISKTGVKNTLQAIGMTAALGFLISASMDFSVYSMNTVYLNAKALTLDIVIGTLMYGFVGFVEALIMLPGKKQKAQA